MKVDKTRLGEIAIALIEHKFKKELKNRIQGLKREVGNLAKETGIPYQNLINLYLRECAQTGKKPALSWAL